MRIIITGAKGQLSRSLQWILREDDVYAIGRPRHDITSLNIISDIVSYEPDLVIHTAAKTDVDQCEENPQDTYAINVDGTKNVAQACNLCGASMVYVSTDYVFDGMKSSAYVETDMPRPVNVYGRSKLLGEKHVQSYLEKYYIVRTGWLYGTGGDNFVTKVLNLASSSSLKMVTTQSGSPTFTDDLAEAIARLIRVPLYGICHLVNEGGCSRYEFACRILECAGRNDVIVEPIVSYPRRAPIPPNVILKNTVAAEQGIILRPWHDALCSFFKYRY